MSRQDLASDPGRRWMRAAAHRRMLALLFLGVAGLVALPASAAVCRVKADGATAADGSSWAQATNLQSALGSAACSEIWVAAGVYKPATGSDRSAHFAIRTGVGVYGGFVGSETARDQRDFAQHRSVLSGDIDGNDAVDAHGVTRDHADIVGDNSYHVVVLGDAAADTVLDGFILSGGLANGEERQSIGGGLLCEASSAGQSCSPSLGHLVIRGNVGRIGGGLVCLGTDAGHCGATVRQVAFIGNDGGMGGAMMVGNAGLGSSSAIVLENATFSRNMGGFALMDMGDSTTATLRNVTFSDNEQYSIIGTGMSEGASLTLTDSVVWDSMPDSVQFQGIAASVLRSSVRGGCPASATTCTGLITGDPQLGALQDSGSMPLYVPGAASVAVDAVDCAGVPAQDQRGVTRPQGPRCDIGATEVRSASVTVAVSGGGKVNAIADPVPVGAGIADCREGSGVCTASYRIDPVAPSLLLTLYPDAGREVLSASGCGGSLAAGGFTFGTGAIDADCTINVRFEPVRRSIGGTVTGLLGSGLQLLLAGGETLPIAIDGTFRFDTPLDAGSAYTVTIATQPQQPAQECVVVNGSGVVGGSDISNIVIHCGAAATYTVGGTLSGLAAGKSITLSLNGGSPLTLAANGAYVFEPRFAPGDGYQAGITAQPDAQHCTLAHAEGVVGSGNVSDLDVSCAAGGAQLELDIDDGGTFSRYGQKRDYRITLANRGNGTAANVAIGATFDPAFDQANLRWICVVGTPGATCGASGAGSFADVATLPPGTSLVWVVTAPIRADSPDSEARFLVHADGATDASDTNALVLFRDGLDVPYGSGARALDPVPAAATASPRRGGDTLTMSPSGTTPEAESGLTVASHMTMAGMMPAVVAESSGPRAITAPGDPNAVPVDDPATLLSLLLILMLGGGAMAARRNDPPRF